MTEGLNILVVDDEEAMRDALYEMLHRKGHNVTVARDGYRGLKLLDSKDFDIVILDLKMPGISGMEVLSEIKNKNPETIVIVITGYATVESAVNAMKLGAYDFIPKPFTPPELNAIIKRAEEKRKLAIENIYLHEQLSTYMRMDGIIGESEAMIKIKELIRKIAPTDSTILISGESGTGKELVARAIHRYSKRKNKPFVTFDCGSIVESLFESELFGHVKGSFTGAIATRHGKFELGNRGTIFFDEIANISINVQGKLLRAIQEREISKVGSTQTIKIDVRIISATNKDLVKGIRDGTFREDLFYRLSVIPIHLPPLREQRDDIPILANYFLGRYNRKRKKGVKTISERAMHELTTYDWPGNVRELQNIIERAVVLAKGDIIKPADLFYPSRTDSERPADSTLESVEKEHINKILKACNWNKSKAARLLKIDRKTLRLKIKKYGIKSGNNSPEPG
ncbi:sigma-54-dependent Fis family transcriptional regulator [candidate division WOR-3 bacterium]|nr:sigma-54-dependent Fis family transcriptional regulator [candidate division WOR-3 bacterium]MCK4527185.1 sigma-54-dependent Fis family transcriptional regulator [candidate division WOR-3 bacterium]